MKYSIRIILLLWQAYPLVFGFGVTRQQQQCLSNASKNSFVILNAKKAQRNKKKTKGTNDNNNNNSGGGFGAATASSTKENNKVHEDFKAFPALESSVKETLVPSSHELQTESGELPFEIYDRLSQIYGFTNFNFESQQPKSNDADSTSTTSTDSLESIMSITPESTSTKLSGGPLDFKELVSSSKSSSSSSSSSSSLLSNNDFADLLGEVTGEITKKSTTSIATNLKSSIESLPPFEQMRVLHTDPLVIAIDDFFTNEECDRQIERSAQAASNVVGDDNSPLQVQSKTVGKDALAKAQRTSTTWFHHYKNAPELMAKACRLLGLYSIDQWEEPQTVRYRRNEKFTWHLDAIAPSKELQDLGGQRTATLLVYLTDLQESDGGATVFRDLGINGDTYLKVNPKKGSALLFFPAAGGIPNCPFDIRTLHCGEIVDKSASQDKWISQLWLRQGTYAPSAPPGNLHATAMDAITDYCSNAASK